MASLIPLVRQMTQEPQRVARVAGYDLPWTNPMFTHFFAVGKLSRCVGKDGFDRQLALVEVPDVAAYLDRWFQLVCKRSLLDEFSGLSLEEAMGKLPKEFHGETLDGPGCIQKAFDILANAVDFTDGPKEGQVTMGFLSELPMEHRVHTVFFLLELGYCRLTAPEGVQETLQ